MGIKDRGPGGPQDDATVTTEEAIVRQATPADVAGEALVNTEEVVPAEEATISSDAREALPMPAFVPVTAELVPVAIPAAAESAPTVSAVVVPAPAEPSHAPVSDARPAHSEATFGLSVLAFGGLLAVLRDKRGKDRQEDERA